MRPCHRDNETPVLVLAEDRVSFGSWSPRGIWLGGRERVSLGDPKRHPIPQTGVEQLIGKDEAEG